VQESDNPLSIQVLHGCCRSHFSLCRQHVVALLESPSCEALTSSVCKGCRIGSALACAYSEARRGGAESLHSCPRAVDAKTRSSADREVQQSQLVVAQVLQWALGPTRIADATAGWWAVGYITASSFVTEHLRPWIWHFFDVPGQHPTPSSSAMQPSKDSRATTSCSECQRRKQRVPWPWHCAPSLSTG
jgi:hypothetical protein